MLTNTNIYINQSCQRSIRIIFRCFSSHLLVPWRSLGVRPRTFLESASAKERRTRRGSWPSPWREQATKIWWRCTGGTPASKSIVVLIFPGGQKPNEPSLRRREKTQSVLLWPDFRTRALSPSCRLQVQLLRRSPAVLSSWKMQIKHFFQLLLEGIPLRVFRPRHSWHQNR